MGDSHDPLSQPSPVVAGQGPLDFLADSPVPGPQRRMTALESKRAFALAWAEADVGAQHRQKYRRCVAWRVTRHLAQIQGLLGREDGLASLPVTPDGPWFAPCAVRLPPDGSDMRTTDTSLWSMDTLVLREGGISLTPRQENVQRYAEIVRRIARETRMYEGSRRVPMMWTYAMGDLRTDEDLLLYWPDPSEVLLFEESVLRHAHHLVISRAKHSTAEDLHNLLGVSRPEAIALSRLAIANHAREAYEDMEEKRYLMEVRLEALAENSRTALNLDAELRALKQLAAIQGLTRTEPTTAMDEILKTIQAVAGAAESPPTTALGPGRPHIAFADDEDDDDAAA